MEKSSLQSIQFELKAPKSKDNDYGKYKYRNCEDILEAVKPLLDKYHSKLVITDEVQQIGPIVVITAKVIFTDAAGEVTVVTAHAGVDVNKKGMDVAQTFGASSSYARKYALNGLFLIDDTKDYDSNEYHRQVNNLANQQNQSSQQQNQNTQQPVQQQAAPPKPKDTRTQQQIYESALATIPETEDRDVLLKAARTFKGTKYETSINKACRARSDQMGWPTKQTQRNQNSPQQPMHH
ncbi:ERF family protein [Acinetobacter sichuanensis]|uniref:ERF family protein n=1 Tax=Acinetobacter sichuanensis TaxID=2136183 RepID=UPI00280C672D|nr:ERF family protein [Acinetobacter sichuanensis]MDQ9023348.1 ERF family protein [Acinetobacter sichuanensis]